MSTLDLDELQAKYTGVDADVVSLIESWKLVVLTGLSPLLADLSHHAQDWLPLQPTVDQLAKLVRAMYHSEAGPHVPWCAHGYPHEGLTCSLIHRYDCPCRSGR